MLFMLRTIHILNTYWKRNKPRKKNITLKQSFSNNLRQFPKIALTNCLGQIIFASVQRMNDIQLPKC